jgi:hypothetical protein
VCSDAAANMLRLPSDHSLLSPTCLCFLSSTIYLFLLVLLVLVSP